jgi:hypothetical protein
LFDVYLSLFNTYNSLNNKTKSLEVAKQIETVYGRLEQSEYVKSQKPKHIEVFKQYTNDYKAVSNYIKENTKNREINDNSLSNLNAQGGFPYFDSCDLEDDIDISAPEITNKQVPDKQDDLKNYFVDIDIGSAMEATESEKDESESDQIFVDTSVFSKLPNEAGILQSTNNINLQADDDFVDVSTSVASTNTVTTITIPSGSYTKVDSITGLPVTDIKNHKGKIKFCRDFLDSIKVDRRTGKPIDPWFEGEYIMRGTYRKNPTKYKCEISFNDFLNLVYTDEYLPKVVQFKREKIASLSTNKNSENAATSSYKNDDSYEDNYSSDSYSPEEEWSERSSDEQSSSQSDESVDIEYAAKSLKQQSIRSRRINNNNSNYTTNEKTKNTQTVALSTVDKQIRKRQPSDHEKQQTLKKARVDQGAQILPEKLLISQYFNKIKPLPALSSLGLNRKDIYEIIEQTKDKKNWLSKENKKAGCIIVVNDSIGKLFSSLISTVKNILNIKTAKDHTKGQNVYRIHIDNIDTFSTYLSLTYNALIDDNRTEVATIQPNNSEKVQDKLQVLVPEMSSNPTINVCNDNYASSDGEHFDMEITDDIVETKQFEFPEQTNPISQGSENNATISNSIASNRNVCNESDDEFIELNTDSTGTAQTIVLESFFLDLNRCDGDENDKDAQPSISSNRNVSECSDKESMELNSNSIGTNQTTASESIFLDLNNYDGDENDINNKEQPLLYSTPPIVVNGMADSSNIASAMSLQSNNLEKEQVSVNADQQQLSFREAVSRVENHCNFFQSEIAKRNSAIGTTNTLHIPQQLSTHVQPSVNRLPVRRVRRRLILTPEEKERRRMEQIQNHQLVTNFANQFQSRLNSVLSHTKDSSNEGHSRNLHHL